MIIHCMCLCVTRYHQAEILATLVNEYTGWERPVQHPANILQETQEALSDGLVVAPLTYSADLHSSLLHMYVFSHQSRHVGHPQVWRRTVYINETYHIPRSSSEIYKVMSTANEMVRKRPDPANHETC